MIALGSIAPGLLYFWFCIPFEKMWTKRSIGNTEVIQVASVSDLNKSVSYDETPRLEDNKSVV
ncbi:hypothetical protein J4Q44_G00089790 [Coregonus suidteri]|uniref:Uncharacterized protein n=1 Tax=Coregonus suidteri TaxID=861788 RepID=A0AAN8M643_9TELE